MLMSKVENSHNAIILHVYRYQNKNVLFRGEPFPTKQNSLKAFEITLIGWKKDGSPKSHFCFGHVNRLLMPFHILWPNNFPDVVAQQRKDLQTEPFGMEWYRQHKA